MAQSQSGQGRHCSPVIQGNAFFVICSLPVDVSEAAEWFAEQHGGFTQFIFK